LRLKGLADAAQNYHTVLAENRRLYNEVQDLKGTSLSVVLLGCFCCLSLLVVSECHSFYSFSLSYVGNIRVYCRIRPFLPGQSKKHTTIEYIGENGELVIVNPSKGKDSRRSFKFNKVFGPTSTQGISF
jgi:kinesin family protein C2/C3